MVRTFLCKLTFITFFLVLISCEQAVYTGPPEEPKPENGKIMVDSNPSGALIYLDGKNMGSKTPSYLNGLTYGSHSITLKLNLYIDGKIGLFVNGDYTNTIFYDFVSDPQNFGSIQCSSNPDSCNIYINDSLTSKKTPYYFGKLKPGSYKIKFTHYDYRADSVVSIVKASATTSVYMALEDTSKFVNYISFNSGLPSNIVNYVTVDRSNHIWIGTGNGLAKFDGKKWQRFNIKNSPLNSGYISRIAVDDLNRILIGTPMGFYTFDGSNWTDFSAEINYSSVNDVIVAPSGDYWVGTRDGLYKYSNGVWTVFNTANSSLADNFVTCLAIDKQNRIWIGSNYHGISVLDGNTWSFHNKSNMNIKVPDQVNAICVNTDGKIWANFWSDALIIYDGTSWSEYTKGINNRTVLTFCPDGNRLLFGTKQGGMYALDSNGE
ncbi:MAG: PEGA domain-containing protein, partial [Bacteroidetes bacterium]|nr:PEGA domain-containing protein [Bacteroidota bacterium]